jgi:hypothetical protein
MVLHGKIFTKTPARCFNVLGHILLLTAKMRVEHLEGHSSERGKRGMLLHYIPNFLNGDIYLLYCLKGSKTTHPGCCKPGSQVYCSVN